MLFGLWVSNHNAGTIAAALEHATNFLSVAQSQPSPARTWSAIGILAHSLMRSGDYPAALAHFETAASLYRPDEHGISAFRYGQDIGVSAFVQLSWVLWHCGYPDRSARAADRALALSRQLGHAHTLTHALGLAGTAAAFAHDVATVRARGNDCVALASKHGFALWAAHGRILQGWAIAQRGEATTGIAHIRDGMAALEATGTHISTPFYLALLAEALALAGKNREGVAALDGALAKAAASGEKGWNAEIHRSCGELTGRLPYPDPAKARIVPHRPRDRRSKARGATNCAPRRASPACGAYRAAGARPATCSPRLDSFTEGFDTPDLKDAKTLLDELA